MWFLSGIKQTGILKSSRSRPNEKSLLWVWINNKKQQSIKLNSYHNNTDICPCASYAPYMCGWVEYTKKLDISYQI